MEQPPEWRVQTTGEFDAEFAALVAANPRLKRIQTAWMFYLLRQPFRFAKGLTAPDDETRVFTTVDEREGIEYVIGLTVASRRQTVTCEWIDSLPAYED